MSVFPSQVLSEDDFSKIFNNINESSNVLALLKEDIENQFNIKVAKCYYHHQTVKYGEQNKEINLICVYVYFQKDFVNIQKNKLLKNKLNDEIIKYIKSIDLQNELHSEYGFIINYDSYEYQAKVQIYRYASNAFEKEFFKKHFNCETMDSLYGNLNVIYKTKQLMESAKQSGEMKRIFDSYYEFIAQFDKYNVINKSNVFVNFDCVENVEAHGGWFHYDRDIAF